MITLTPEQTAIIPIYREKWRQIGLSAKPTDRPQAAAAINTAYNIIGCPQPEIIYFDSPHAAWQAFQPLIGRDLSSELGSEIRNKIHSELYNQLRYQLGSELENQLYDRLYNPLFDQLMSQLQQQIKDELQNRLFSQLNSDFSGIRKSLFYRDGCIFSELSACHGSWVDFCISVLKLKCDRPLYSAFQSLTENCGWIYPFAKKCFVCDRPRRIYFDAENLLHAEGMPAVEFADKFSVYCYRGVRIPEIYGQIPPQSWQAKWLLTENNAEVRRVLIQAIGYPKICQELQATELDSWQEYILLKIDKNVDVEPIYLLKMTCPSTGHIHALRVPPEVRSAIEAIGWINWGIKPEEFAVQT
jgi:hypothetical protein